MLYLLIEYGAKIIGFSTLELSARLIPAANMERFVLYAERPTPKSFYHLHLQIRKNVFTNNKHA